MSTKRFIAGAVCPRCAEMDKIVLYTREAGDEVRECIKCGYQDVMTEQGPKKNSDEELETRVNQPRLGEKPLAHEDEVQVVNLMDPKKNTRQDH